MENLIIEFEGIRFVAKISKWHNVTITTQRSGNVCPKSFMHLRGVLGDAIKAGKHNLAIIEAIKNNKAIIKL